MSFLSIAGLSFFCELFNKKFFREKQIRIKSVQLHVRMFREVRTKLHLKLLPSSLANIHAAVLRELSAMLLRIEPTLGGVPLSFKAMKIEGDSAAIFEDQPQIHLNVVVTFLVFAPEVGSVITGIVNNLADDTVGLLILNTFNAVIPRDDMPNDYAFDYDAAVWRSKTSGEVVSIGSELSIHCKGMRTTDQGLIQVLAAFDTIAGSAQGSNPQKPKKSKVGKIAAAAAEQESRSGAAKPKKTTRGAASQPAAAVAAAASAAPATGKAKVASHSVDDLPTSAKKGKPRSKAGEPDRLGGVERPKKKARAGTE